MFIIKLAFWAAIVLMLLPSSHKDKQELYGAAEKTVIDLYSFCDRNPDVCNTAGNTFTHILQKVRVGVDTIEEMMSDGKREQAGAEESPNTSGLYSSVSAEPIADEDTAQNTLRQQDLDPEWRSPEPRRP
ncbi:MAG: DUF5330 domain-containing protein [Hyphomicrobiales bacterium]|nr:DUF5330 domain-containing protein [Hyphomicrobiales bacterium]